MEISNVFTISKIIKYYISNIKFFKMQVQKKICEFCCLFAKKKSPFKAKNTLFWKLRSPRTPPPYLGTIHQKNPLKKVIKNIP